MCVFVCVKRWAAGRWVGGGGGGLFGTPVLFGSYPDEQGKEGAPALIISGPPVPILALQGRATFATPDGGRVVLKASSTVAAGKRAGKTVAGPQFHKQ